MFSSKRNLKKHLPSLYNQAQHTNEFFCEKCGQTCGTEPDNLISHIENAHSQKRKTQDSSASTVSRPFLCEICGKRYTQSSHLYQHLRFHKGTNQILLKIFQNSLQFHLHIIICLNYF